MSDSITRLNEALSDRYRIERKIGEGGMASVYLAEDVKHERKVALKVLKPELAAVVGAERFLAEIKTTANLQHPHILPLHDSGEADGFLFFVMPYVDGESLRDRLDREKQLPVDEAVRIASDLAEALHAAHEQGVVHRDIKPANVLLSRGRPLIADFGIALAVTAAGGGRMTETGLSLGTPHYMSPEQATGDQAVGPTTDIYALGCVLYEMLVGEPPYTGSTAQAILGKIIAGELASTTTQRSSVPAHVDAAIRRALEKLAADRFTSAEALGRALADPGFRHDEADTAVPGGGAAVAGGRWRRIALAMTVLAAAFAATAAWGWLRPVPQPRPMAPLSADQLFPPDSGPSDQGFSISPDGSELAFVSELLLDGGRIWIRSMVTGQRRPLPNTERSSSPAWSPGGERIAFRHYSGRQLFVTPASGGPVLLLAEFEQGVSRPTWTPDGRVVFVADGGIWAASDAGGQPAELVSRGTLEGGFNPLIAPLPDGQAFVLGRGGRPSNLYLGEFGSGTLELLVENAADPRYADGWLLFTRTGGGLFAQRFDIESRTLAGPLVPLVERVPTPGSRSQFDVRSNTLVYSPRLGEDGPAGRLRWLNVDGTTTPVPDAFDPSGWMRALSRDGTRLASGGFALVVMDSDGGLPRRIDAAGERGFGPRWSDDGDALLFSGEGGGLYHVGTNPGDEPTLLVSLSPGMESLVPVDWGPDGEVLFIANHDDGSSELRVLDAGGEEVSVLLPGAIDGALSPDARWLAYVSSQGEERQVFLREYPGGEEVRISIEGGHSPAWGPEGDVVYFISPRGEPLRVALSFEEGLTPSAPVQLPVDFAVTNVMPHPDGRVLLDAAARARTSLKVVRDWQGLGGGP